MTKRLILSEEMNDSRKAFEAWQAAERETARKCYDIIAGQGAPGGSRLAYAEAIKAAFPEAFAQRTEQ